MDKTHLQRAIELATRGMDSGEGGPFGCVIVKNGTIIAEGYNRVTSENDPTAHAEIVAIRKACEALGSFQLTGCDLYTSCEPCPMCLGAIYWARPDHVYYAATRQDAAEAGFDDDFIYEELAISPEKRNIPFIKVDMNQAKQPFLLWSQKSDKIEY